MSRSQAEIAAALKEAFAAGAMLAFEPPGSGGLVMAVERRQVEQAMSLWSVMPAPIREDRISSVRREEMRAELQALNERTLQRELRAHGITDGLKIGVQLRRQLEQMGANFDKPEEVA